MSSPLHNKLSEVDRPVHAWYRFVLSFPPHLVRQYLSEFEVGNGDAVLDPFCGTGTTLVESKKHGIASVGLEANPMAAFASRVKCNWNVSPGSLRDASWAIGGALDAEFRAAGLEFKPQALERAPTERDLFGFRTLNEYAEKLLLAGSISPRPLHRCLSLREQIDSAPADIRDHLLLALAWVTVNVAGNVRFGPEVGITKPRFDANVIGEWRRQVARMADDLEGLSNLSSTRASVHLADAREPDGLIAPGSISAVFTSPPYPNEKDYTRTTRLESVLIGLLNNRADLRNLKQQLLRSNTRNVYVSDDDDKLVEKNSEIQRIAEAIERRRKELGKTSGFEKLYHRVAKLYFGGMSRHFRELKRYLKPGAMLGYVVGDQASYLRVPIRTGDLLAGIAKEHGYEHVENRLFRTRLSTATKEQLREEVMILRWNEG